MQKTITVKGVGTAHVKPDYVLLSMALNTKHKVYEKAMEGAAESICQINQCLERIGFEKEAVKTTDFFVQTDYEGKKDLQGNYHRVFTGYIITHQLKVAFDFDAGRLAQALGAIAKCVAQPELSVRFTVKDPTAVSEVLLASACENARRKAEILCAASGVVLGSLLSIDYTWNELNILSHTRYEIEDSCSEKMAAIQPEFEPEDLHVSDTATFVWEIG